MSDPKATASVISLPAQSYVYVIGDASGPQKVGFAADPKRRLALFRTGNMGDLRIAIAAPISRELAREAERYAHWLLREHHARGEWFSVAPEEACAAVEHAIKAVTAGDTAPQLDFGGVGRPSLIAGKKVRQTAVWLHEDMIDRINALVGKRGFSAFAREALEAELQRRESVAKSD